MVYAGGSALRGLRLKTGAQSVRRRTRLECVEKVRGRIFADAVSDTGNKVKNGFADVCAPRVAIREGGRTVGSGRVASIIE